MLQPYSRQLSGERIKTRKRMKNSFTKNQTITYNVRHVYIYIDMAQPKIPYTIHYPWFMFTTRMFAVRIIFILTLHLDILSRKTI